ncbi:hypothetical protein NEOLEDRAFT_1046329, partial [Neolentinus lepideus HHB14362 ss-1]
LGHTNPRTVVEMATHNSVTGMRIDLSTQPPKCDHCILGKQVKNSPPKVRAGAKADRKLGIIFADLMEESVVSASGKKFVLNLVDDHTSFMWSIPLPTK